MEINRKTRKKALLLLIVLIIAMLIPVKYHYRDGGTVEYKAVLYSVIKWNALTSVQHRMGCQTGTEIRILSFTVYDDSVFVPDNIEHVLSPAE